MAREVREIPVYVRFPTDDGGKVCVHMCGWHRFLPLLCLGVL